MSLSTTKDNCYIKLVHLDYYLTRCKIINYLWFIWHPLHGWKFILNKVKYFK